MKIDQNLWNGEIGLFERPEWPSNCIFFSRVKRLTVCNDTRNLPCARNTHYARNILFKSAHCARNLPCVKLFVRKIKVPYIKTYTMQGYPVQGLTVLSTYCAAWCSSSHHLHLWLRYTTSVYLALQVWKSHFRQLLAQNVE